MHHCVSAPKCTQIFVNGRAGAWREAVDLYIWQINRNLEGRKSSRWMLTRQVSCPRVVNTKIDVEATRSATKSSPAASVRSSLAELISVTGGTQRVVTQEESLRRGQWAKLICGASFEDAVEIRHLALVYTLAGVECIDCSAEVAVVEAVASGIGAATSLAAALGVGELRRPWVMVSVNVDEDPHFRKASFNPDLCPSDCLRPCESVCPAAAIQGEGVIAYRCYGCGRCLPVCPIGLISATSYVRKAEDVALLLESSLVDAVEIHTKGGEVDEFKELWTEISSVAGGLKLVAVSLPASPAMEAEMCAMFATMQPALPTLNLWQLDGRPMSGDIGAGATRAAVVLAQRVMRMAGRPPGFLQLAGGTNAATVGALASVGCTVRGGGDAGCRGSVEEDAAISGIGYGGYARKILRPVLEQLAVRDNAFAYLHEDALALETHLKLLKEGLLIAAGLLAPLKGYSIVPNRSSN